MWNMVHSLSQPQHPGYNDVVEGSTYWLKAWTEHAASRIAAAAFAVGGLCPCTGTGERDDVVATAGPEPAADRTSAVASYDRQRGEVHPARFTESVPEFFIKFLTRPADIVVDLFAGSNVVV